MVTDTGSDSHALVLSILSRNYHSKSSFKGPSLQRKGESDAERALENSEGQIQIPSLSLQNIRFYV